MLPSDAPLIKESSDYGVKLAQERAKNMSEVDRSICMNTSAHGYFMGHRESEKRKRSYVKKWDVSDHRLTDISDHAADAYLSAKGYVNLSSDKRSMISALLASSFRVGYRAHQAKVQGA